MRAVDRQKGHITYKLNILGLRVLKGSCQLIAKQGSDWVAIGSARKLPMRLPKDSDAAESDPLVLTIFQYQVACPGSDLRAVVEGRRPFEEALEH
jgi:hypothetical protein